MGLLTYSDEQLAADALAAARAAMDAGHRFFAYRLFSGVGSKNNADALLNVTLNGAAEIGWRLHSVTPYIQTIGPNRDVVLLTFER
jgi:3-deoxy-D-arabino-heptulosonate 7-phosphate (DAHP) synthase